MRALSRILRLCSFTLCLAAAALVAAPPARADTLPSVAAAAVDYFHEHGETGVDRGSESSAVLGSPRRFSAYTLAALLATLPKAAP